MIPLGVLKDLVTITFRSIEASNINLGRCAHT